MGQQAARQNTRQDRANSNNIILLINPLPSGNQKSSLASYVTQVGSADPLQSHVKA